MASLQAVFLTLNANASRFWYTQMIHRTAPFAKVCVRKNAEFYACSTLAPHHSTVSMNFRIALSINIPSTPFGMLIRFGRVGVVE